MRRMTYFPWNEETPHIISNQAVSNMYDDRARGRPNRGLLCLCVMSTVMYNVVFLVVTYVVPMCSMAVTYTWVGCVLWGSKVIGENTDLQYDVVRSKQRVVHMLIAIVVLFGVCWLPYHVYFLYVYYHQEAIVSQYIQHIYLTIYWFAMSNSCYNPIVYYWMNSRFREYFRTVLCLPKRGLQKVGWLKEHPKTPKTTTFTCSTRSRSCRVTVPYPRAANGHLPTRFVCSRL